MALLGFHVKLPAWLLPISHKNEKKSWAPLLLQRPQATKVFWQAAPWVAKPNPPMALRLVGLSLPAGFLKTGGLPKFAVFIGAIVVSNSSFSSYSMYIVKHCIYTSLYILFLLCFFSDKPTLIMSIMFRNFWSFRWSDSQGLACCLVSNVWDATEAMADDIGCFPLTSVFFHQLQRSSAHRTQTLPTIQPVF